jgi:hypothetical protein
VKVCFFNRSYWPDQAATGQFLTELAEDLVSRYGTEVTVVAGRAVNASRVEAASGLDLVSRELHQGVDIRRANGSRLRQGRFVARASNYVSYFAAATAASFNLGRPADCRPDRAVGRAPHRCAFRVSLRGHLSRSGGVARGFPQQRRQRRA